MTRSKTKHHRKTTSRRVIPVIVKLKSSFFEGVLREVMVRVYGEDMGGFSFETGGKQSLKESCDSFMENMWTQVKQIVEDNGKVVIGKESIDEWKRRTGFKLRRKLSSISLCRLFENEIGYTPRI